jgi:hypothetical protein
MDAVLGIVYLLGVLGVPGIAVAWLIARRVEPRDGAVGYIGTSFAIGIAVAFLVALPYAALFLLLPIADDDGLGRGFLFVGMVLAFGFNLGSATGTAAMVLDRRSVTES